MQLKCAENHTNQPNCVQFNFEDEKNHPLSSSLPFFHRIDAIAYKSRSREIAFKKIIMFKPPNECSKK
jgi:hypothetical protein